MKIHLPDEWFAAGTPLVFGHRGDSCHAPENTMAAFQAAVESGADGIELDVHLTRDGFPVVIHNNSVDATTNGQGLVEAMSLAEVQRLDAGVHFDPKFSGEVVPLLRDVLGTFASNLLINIELKPSRKQTKALNAAVVQDIQATGSQNRIWFSSFDVRAILHMRGLRPDLPSGFLFSPLPRWQYVFVQRNQFAAIHPHYTWVTRRRVGRAHALGQRVSAWTVDDASVARKLRDFGVDVVISNDPARIRRELFGDV